MMLASASGSARSTARKSSPAGNGFLRRALPGSPTRARAVMNASRLRVMRGLSWVGSESGISVHPLPVRIGVGNAELRENLLFETFHGFGVVVFFVIVTDQMQESVHGEMA